MSGSGWRAQPHSRLPAWLAMKRWTKAQEFSEVLVPCAEPSIEVFWKTPLRIS
jgi:hypothetical protein